MDPVFTTGVVALGLGTTTLWLGLRAQDFRAQLRANEEDLLRMARELKGAELTANGLREQTRALSASIAVQAQEKTRMREARDQSDAQLHELSRERDRLHGQVTRLRALETELSEQRRRLAEEQAAHQGTRADRDQRSAQLHELAGQYQAVIAAPGPVLGRHGEGNLLGRSLADLRMHLDGGADR